jgi:large subunit ribosomal protein L9
MQIILLQNINKVGHKHEIVKVKPGYARNFLIPQGMAIVANDTNLRRLNELRRREASQESKTMAHAQFIAEKLQGKMLRIGAKAGTSGKIFGSVTNVQLAQALKEQYEIDVDRRIIEIPDEVKILGTYRASIGLHKDVPVGFDFEVVED